MGIVSTNQQQVVRRAAHWIRLRPRALALLGWDITAWLVALSIATLLRFDGNTDLVDAGGLAATLIVAVGAHCVIGMSLQLYRGRYGTGSVDDALNVGIAVGLVGIALFVMVLLVEVPPVPRSVPPVAALVALLLALGLRVCKRRWRERAARPDRRSARRVIVLGAGVEGQQLVRSMNSVAGSVYLPVALLDDDPELQQRRVSRVAVRGSRADLADVASATRADLLVVAARDLDAAAMNELNEAAIAAGLEVKVLPPLSELLRPGVELADLRDLDISDLLGRRPVEIDVSVIAEYITGRRVLVTGAGGSIGSELCRQVHAFGPAELLMLDHDESALHGTQLSIYGSALLDSPDVILVDIRDAESLTALFCQRRPEVVFHAAALKHLPMLEQYPAEAWKSNVLGTQNVLDAAVRGGAQTFVNISTDKAADPTSVLGQSKRIGERLVAAAAQYADGSYVSVRFGNVLGSRGSVLTTFTEQLAAGGPITVTHPDVTRFFMTVSEAVQLVVYSAAIGRPGEALVLDMGEPVHIEQVAHQLMAIADHSVPIVYTGLRPGEKLHEQLLGLGERDDRPVHPAVSQVAVPPLTMRCAIEHAERVGPEQAMIDLPTMAFPIGVADGDRAMILVAGSGSPR